MGSNILASMELGSALRVALERREGGERERERESVKTAHTAPPVLPGGSKHPPPHIQSDPVTPRGSIGGRSGGGLPKKEVCCNKVFGRSGGGGEGFV